MNRVSKVSVKEVLSEYLADALVEDIMIAIEKASDAERGRVLGMSVIDFLDRFDNSVDIMWAANPGGGIAKAGDAVCGSLENLVVHGVFGTPGSGHPVSLLVWWDKEWREAEKRFDIVSKDGSSKEVYATDWESAAKAEIADGNENFKVYRWLGRHEGSDMTSLAGSVSYGRINKKYYGPLA